MAAAVLRLAKLPALAVGLALLAPACSKGKDGAEGKAKSEKKGDAEAKSEAETGAGEDGAEPAAKQSATALLSWLPPDAQSVAYDRLDERLDPAVVAVVFGLPPTAADLLEERKILDEALDISLDGDAEPENWLGPKSLAFTVALSKTPYFLRPLSKPASEVGPLLADAGFTKNTGSEDIELWLPRGAFPWRIALLDDELAAFVPADIPGTGLEPLTGGQEAEPSPVEQQLAEALDKNPAIRLTLVSAGPMLHYDVKDPVAQIQFALMQPLGAKGYEGEIVLASGGDVDEATNQLNARKHPEENQQVQALIGAVNFVVSEGMVTGRLSIADDQVKHFLDR